MLMVGVAQLVRAPGCGPGGRGFKSHRSPQNEMDKPVLQAIAWKTGLFFYDIKSPSAEIISVNGLLFLRIGNDIKA